jgi:mycothiol system anti-sigma-R factor
METGDEAADCSQTVERLYQYLDGELTDERRQKIKRHLDECSPCLQAVGFEQELRIVIASRCKDRVPEELLQRIKAAIQEEEQQQSH